MRGNKAVILFLACGLIVSGFFAYFFYQSKNTEHNLRTQKEQELNTRLNELAEKEGALATANEQKAELEKSLSGKVSDLENALKKTQNALSDRMAEFDRLTLDNDSLKADALVKESKLSDLSKRVQVLTSEKMELQARIKALESESQQAVDAPSASESTTSSPYGIQENKNMSAISSVQLGKIVMQKSSGRGAQIIHVNKIYQFVVMNAGSLDGIKKGNILNVVRDGAVIGKVVVEKTKENTAAAVILTEWTREDLREGDQITVF